MTLLKTAIVLALVLALAGVASAATIAMTAPFPGFLLRSGLALCAVTNFSDRTTTTARAILYDNFGNAVDDRTFTALLPNDTGFGNMIVLTGEVSPTVCKCILPNRQHKCSLMYVNGTSVTVVPGN
jgi:hypothetical protein